MLNLSVNFILFCSDDVEVSNADTVEDEKSEPSMPAPQLKVGPDGQLIIDEQSLVVEHSDAKKCREAAISRSKAKVIIEEDGDGRTEGGFYKRRKNSKEWASWETLKFYKALNTIGTDFLLMQSLFPERNRRELKQKFKKEERINRKLVDKALKYFREFDVETLEKELGKYFYSYLNYTS